MLFTFFTLMYVFFAGDPDNNSYSNLNIQLGDDGSPDAEDGEVNVEGGQELSDASTGVGKRETRDPDDAVNVLHVPPDSWSECW